MSDIETLRRILACNRVIAVVGLSAEWHRPSFFAAKYMKEHGYRIVPINPRYETILGETCYPSLQSLPQSLAAEVGIVDCFRRTADILLGREFEAHTLQPTALVNEVYLKLARGGNPDATSRAHFLGIAARAMRQILVDHARRRKAAKRGKGEVFVTLGDHEDVASPDADSMIALDDALARLTAFDARLAKVVELRFFGGLTEDQVAATLGVTTRTVQRDWAKARAWLHAQITADG